MKFMMKIAALITGLSLLATPLAYAGTELFSEGFENTAENWNVADEPRISRSGENAAMELAGDNNICIIMQDSYSNASISVQFQDISAAGGYIGVALRVTDNSRYEFRRYSGIIKIVRIKDGEEHVIAAEGVIDLPSDCKIKFSAKDSILRAEINGATVLSVIDNELLPAGGAAIVSDKAHATAKDVTVAEESSFFYETFENEKFSSFVNASEAPQLMSNNADGGFEVGYVENKGVLHTKNSGDNCRILYPAPAEGNGASTAMIAGIKCDTWENENGQGFCLLNRYSAPNKTYMLKSAGSRLIIQKYMPGATEELAATDNLDINGALYHEVALEALNKTDGSVDLNVYFDGRKVAAATDYIDTYQQGRFGIEKSGNSALYIDYVNLRAVDKNNTLENSYSSDKEIKDITLEINDIVAVPDIPLQLCSGTVMMSVSQMSQILQTPFIGNERNGYFDKDGLKVELSALSDIAQVNGESVEMPVPADSKDGKIIASASFVMGLYGAIVSLNENTMLLSVSYSPTILANTSLYTKNGNVFAISDDGKYFKYAKVSGVDGHYRSNKQAVWRAYFIDEKTEALNKKLEAERTQGWGSNWQLGTDICTSSTATFLSDNWDSDNGILTLKYSHARVDVTVKVTFGANRLEISCNAVNKDNSVLQYFCPISEWSYCYSKNNTLLLPRSYAMMEYDTNSWFYYNSYNTLIDGYAVTGNGVMSTYNIQHEYKDGDDEHIMATESQIYAGEFARSIRLYSGTIVYREKGQSFNSVSVAIVANKDLRSFADDYVNTCYPGTRKIMDKILDLQDKETIPKSNILRLNAIGVKFNDMSAVIPHLPGHSMFHSTAVLNQTNKKYGYWDAFPNYFPPIETSGTMEDYENYFRTARANGHSYLPRTSLFYGTDGSGLDLKLQEEGMTINDIAISNINRQSQRAYYGVPGIIYSPASKRAINFFEETWNQWNKMSVTNFFTNVITVVTPMYIRYDFHPDAESPDYMYDYQARLMQWHGERAPVYSEGLCGMRIPYQAGFMTDARWDPDLDPALSSTGAIRTRYDIPALILSEYAKIFPHNVSDEQQVSNRALTFSLLYNYGFKMRLNLATQPSDANLRWLRGQGILGELVMSRLYGARLEKEADYSNDVLTAKYSGNTVTGTLSEKPIKCGSYTISKEGFEFKSADGKVKAGTYDRYNYHELGQSTLLLFENTDAHTQKIYAPIADRSFTINVPLSGFSKPRITAYFADGTQQELNAEFDGSNVTFTYPCFPLSDGTPVRLDNGVVIETSKLIPYVEITDDGNVLQQENLNIRTILPIDAYNSLEAIPDAMTCRVIIENPGKKELDGRVTIQGIYFGNVVNQTYDVKGSDAENSLVIKLVKNAFSTDTGARLTINTENLPVANPHEVILEKRSTSMLASLEELTNKKYKLKLDWDTAAKLPDTVSLTTDAVNYGGSGYSLAKGQKLIIADSKNFAVTAVNASNKYYIEMLARITDSANYRYSKNFWQDILKVTGPNSTTPIALKYGSFENTLRLNVTDASASAFTVPGNTNRESALPDVKIGEWMHIVIDVNGTNARLCVNGKEVNGALGACIGKTDGAIEIGGSLGMDIGYIRIAK